MHELVDFLVKQIIPADSYDIVLLEDGNNVNIQVFVDKSEVAKLIGKFGRTAKAIRTIVKATAHGSDIRYDVVIEERNAE